MGTCEFNMLYSTGCPRAANQLKILRKMVADNPSQITLRTYDVDNPIEKEAARSERQDAYTAYSISKMSPTTSLYRGGTWIHAWCGEQTSKILLDSCSGTPAPRSIRKFTLAPASIRADHTQLAAASGDSILNITVGVRTHQPGRE